MKDRKRAIVLALAVLLIALSACGEQRVPEPTPEPAPTAAPLPAPTAAGTAAESSAPAEAETPEPTPEPTPAPEPVFEYGRSYDQRFGSFQYLSATGLTPYVFVPTGAGGGEPEDYLGVSEMLSIFGEENGMLGACNAGIFYDTTQPGLYCFNAFEADGVVIAGGVVLKSLEALDHSECDILVIDADGSAGWADYWADADALAAGTATYYDIYGRPVTGKRIVSAVTGFVPILIGGENVYNSEDTTRHGYHNYVDHYTDAAARQIIGVKPDGSYVFLVNDSDWTLSDAAEAAKSLGCVFAYNLDGGSSVETAVAHTEAGYRVETLKKLRYGFNRVPTYFVFTASDRLPVSAVPASIRASVPEGTVFPAGAALPEIAGALEVTEVLTNANGRHSERRVYSAQALDGRSLYHTVIGGSENRAECLVRTQTTSPNGTLYYTKSEADSAHSLYWNKNTRLDGKYYDYSTGFTVSTADDLSTPGEKTVLVSYVPGGGYAPLTAEITVQLS